MKKKSEGEIRVRCAREAYSRMRLCMTMRPIGQTNIVTGSDAVGEACILSTDVAQGEAAEGE